MGFAPGDCELVEQIERKLLPLLAVRIVSSGTSCTPNQMAMNQPRLEVEALTELPKVDNGADDAVGGKSRKKKSG